MKILHAVETLNEGIENNARFATFRASRHYAGRTKARSAYDAKEITVNFNRKGAGGKTAGFKSDKRVVEDAAKLFGISSQILARAGSSSTPPYRLLPPRSRTSRTPTVR